MDRADSPAATRIPLWRQFDAAWYRARYPEAVTRDPEDHYRSIGARLGHSPNMFFDEQWYLEAYPDIASHVAAGGAESGFAHYVADGLHGRSPHWLFDEGYYRSIHPDLGQGGEWATDPSVGYVNGYDHFLEAGDAEGRTGHRFLDPALYRRNAIESDATRTAPGGPFRHFLLDACAAGSTARLSWLFDPDWYLRTYPSLVQDIVLGAWRCALHHYLCNHTPSRFDPQAWFSESFYAATYPDAQAAVTDGSFRNTYEHFIRFGALERRKPHEAVDLGRHAQSLTVQAEMARDQYPDAYAHWVATGGAQALAARPMEEPQTRQLFQRIAELGLAGYARVPLDFTCDQPPAVGVIVVMHNQFALTMGALASLRRDFAGPIELVLVDSGSTDGCATIARQVRGARIVRFDDNVGFLAGCNAGLAEITAPATLFMNNDIALGHGAVAAALARLHGARRVGAVGAKCIRTNGLLQEAGSVVWSDGWTAGYLRDADPDLPEANFVRDVDFCSGAFLMVRTAILRALGGFDPAFMPAYYEETDLCVRLIKAGYRVVYDPQVVIHHVEYASAGVGAAEQLIARNHALFTDKHRDWLRSRCAPGDWLRARQPDAGAGRILFIEDRIPLRTLGSGFVRSNDLIGGMAALGYQITVYPMFPTVTRLHEVAGGFPDTVELLHDRGIDAFADFVADRAGQYDIVWIGRTHNLDRLLDTIIAAGPGLPEHGLVLDTEAVAAPRTLARARLRGEATPQDLTTMLRQELRSAYVCQTVVAVNALDASLIRDAGTERVAVLGHLQRAVPTPTPWARRDGLLFVGALHDQAGPNTDSLVWLVTEILPRVAAQLPDIRLTVAGHVADGVDLGFLRSDPRVDVLGGVEALAPLYDRHRVFVAPTRFAGGIPFKLHEAAAHGLPAVVTDLLAKQVDWPDGTALLCAGADDPAGFAERIVRLYRDEALWDRIRDSALDRIRTENDPADYQARLGQILDSVMAAGLRTERRVG